VQTRFSPEQLAEPDVARSEREIRKCVHCGFCLATCPTYQVLGDERDSPRGRIYLMKEMLENDRPATAEVVTHIDRCLSCLSCMTTCPSGVDYRRLVDHARAHIEKTYRRPLLDRLHRALLAFVMPRPGLFRWSLRAAALARPLRGLLPGRLRTMLELVPRKPSRRAAASDAKTPTAEAARLRVALLPGCVQQVLAPEINAAAERLLARQGARVVLAHKPDCCGSLTHHMGKEDAAHATARIAIDAWIAEIDGPGLDRIAITASGCGATIKDYPAMFADDPAYAEKAKRVAAIARDVSEVVAELGLPPVEARPRPSLPRRIAYQAACSLQHGQKIDALPKSLLTQAGLELTPVADAHLCCGSAGTYNILQPELAGALRDRKVASIERGAPDAIATGNIGCLMQLRAGTAIPAVHTIELLDWATGGPTPAALEGLEKFS
jgi:glycolate oxidase iron-sulfur subunit